MKRKRIAILSNVTIDLIAAKMLKSYDVYFPEGFNSWVQEAINPTSCLYSEHFDAVVVLIDGTELRVLKTEKEVIEQVGIWKESITSLLNHIDALPVFVSTIDFRENNIKSLSERKLGVVLQNDWYQFVQHNIEKRTNVFILDIENTIKEIGRKHFYSNKMWYLSSMPYSRDGINAVYSEIERVLSSAFESRKKIIVLDLDNTLWGGVIGEDGLEGIEISHFKEGQRYYDFQRQLLEMKNRGILLAINSKNKMDDAEEVFQSHPSMLLHDDDFVIKKINWDNKAINLKKMEAELNLSESGFIFIDDNPIERETVKGECPEVLVPLFPSDTTELLSFAEEIWFDYCRPLRVLKEDINKTQMYQSEVLRKQDMVKSLNLDDYIRRIEMVIDIHKMRIEEKERVVQLINKTNQFNVTTKRYTTSEIDSIERDPNNSIYVVYCSDKYGDNGLISIIILRNTKLEVCIDTFLMSCRVMGRKIEDIIIDKITQLSNKPIIAEYIPTKKNTPVKELFDRLGFTLISEVDGHKVYKLNQYSKMNTGIFKEVNFEP